MLPQFGWYCEISYQQIIWILLSSDRPSEKENSCYFLFDVSNALTMTWFPNFFAFYSDIIITSPCICCCQESLFCGIGIYVTTPNVKVHIDLVNRFHYNVVWTRRAVGVTLKWINLNMVPFIKFIVLDVSSPTEIHPNLVMSYNSLLFRFQLRNGGRV